MTHRPPPLNPLRRFVPARSRSCCREERAERSRAERSITVRIQGKTPTKNLFWLSEHILRTLHETLLKRRGWHIFRLGPLWRPFVSEKLGTSAQTGDPPSPRPPFLLFNYFLRQELIRYGRYIAAAVRHFISPGGLPPWQSCWMESGLEAQHLIPCCVCILGVWLPPSLPADLASCSHTHRPNATATLSRTLEPLEHGFSCWVTKKCEQSANSVTDFCWCKPNASPFFFYPAQLTLIAFLIVP